MKKYLFYIALGGWMLSAISNGLAIAHIDIGQYISFIWVLHILIFAIWIPVVLDMRRNKELQELNTNGKSVNFKKQLQFFDIMFAGAPKWMKVLAISGFFYAFVNFALFMFGSEIGSPHVENGIYTLKNRGKLIREISKEEYHQLKAKDVRAFSGHWMLFYGFATAALFKFSHFAEENKANTEGSQA